MIRLFVGLAMPPAVQQRLAPLANGVPGARWVAGRNLHLTLRFIGEIAEDMAEDIDAALAGVAADGFALSLSGIDCFQSRNRVRAIWTAAAGGPALIDLQSKVENVLVRTGLPPETRKFTPHVTVARLNRVPIGKVGPYLIANSDVYVPEFAVDRFNLFQSRLGRGGAEYEVLSDYPLRAPR